MRDLFQEKIDFNDDISRWDVSNVTNMNRMFYGATSFNQPLNNWDVSNVEWMLYMFNNSGMDPEYHNPPNWYVCW